jgi:16S rRNA (cytosine1402-N4)-methyltransferase
LIAVTPDTGYDSFMDSVNMDKGEQPKHTRRPRYAGAHPRQVHEKYKELNAGQYPETVQKVAQGGKTPAGTHRPICVGEILDVLKPKPGDIAVDATLGYGGHATRLLDNILPGGRLLGLDVDPLELPKTEARLRALGHGPEVLQVFHSNYAGLARLLGAEGLEGVDMILADLGCSSMQLDNPLRGFSYKQEGPLDLRMNPNNGLPASKWLRTLDVTKLSAVLADFGDEPHAEGIAQEIARAQAGGPIESTGALAQVVRQALSAHGKPSEEEIKNSLKRVFQAIRIGVNGEFSALETFLRFLPSCLKPGGRAAILTFHSGEDRRVKHAFADGFRLGAYAQICQEVIRPSWEESNANPRAASAKLRWAVKAA